MLVRYDIRPDRTGWTIYDRLTERPAEIAGFVSVGLPLDDAEELADLLNTLAFVRRGASEH